MVMCVLLIGVFVFIAADYLYGRSKRSHRSDIAVDPLTEVVEPAGVKGEIIDYKAMTVSFDPDRHIPNWVAWKLTADRATGSEPRYNTFAADPDVKGSATPDDYRHTGYDRGHMAPAGDMKWDREAMEQSFLMTNIVPQDHSLNRGVWKKIEEKCRQRAVADSVIIVVCGPIPGDPVETRIGANGVVVPQRLFKVILSPYGDHPQAIGFILPNGPTTGGMQQYAVSVDRVEQETGYDFFAALPDDIEDELESTCNFTRWSRIK